jgi:hypothetical protein
MTQLWMRSVNILMRHPGEGRGPEVESALALDTGLRRYDGNFEFQQTGSMNYLEGSQ